MVTMAMSSNEKRALERTKCREALAAHIRKPLVYPDLLQNLRDSRFATWSRCRSQPGPSPTTGRGRIRLVCDRVQQASVAVEPKRCEHPPVSVYMRGARPVARGCYARDLAEFPFGSGEQYRGGEREIFLALAGANEIKTEPARG